MNKVFTEKLISKLKDQIWKIQDSLYKRRIIASIRVYKNDESKDPIEIHLIFRKDVQGQCIKSEELNEKEVQNQISKFENAFKREFKKLKKKNTVRYLISRTILEDGFVDDSVLKIRIFDAANEALKLLS